MMIAKLNAYRDLNEQQLNKARTTNVRLHFLDASSEKDGPSAGISCCLALLSLYKSYPLKNTLALTGELSLTGHVN